MRILHVYKDYFPILGGIENHVRMLAEAEVRAGHQVRVLVTNPANLPAREVMNGVKLIRALRLATIASTPLSPTLPIYTRTLPADIVHLHSPYPLGELAQFVFGRGRPYVLSFHAEVVKQKRLKHLYRPLLRQVLAGANRLVAACEPNLRSSLDLAPFAPKVSLVPYGVEPLPEAAPLIPRRGPTLLFVGKHRHYKGVDDLLKALVELPEAYLLIAGSGPQTSEWQNLAGQLQLGDRVSFLGELPDADLPGIYASGDIFVLPSNSRAEFFGKVLQEAQSVGLPCVVTELGTGTSFVVQGGVTGLVVPPCDPPALARALRTLLENPELRRQMGAAGKARVLAEFTPEVMVERIQEVYRLALQR